MLINDDCIKSMKKINSKKIDLIFADPPYFLSNGGKSVNVNLKKKESVHVRFLI